MGAVAALDSVLLGGLYTTDALRLVLGERGLLDRYLAVEAATAHSQADLGVIPAEAASAISTIRVDDLDTEQLGLRASEVGYPIIGLVEQLTTLVHDGMGQWAHWGLTTQDVTDTAQVLQVRDSLALIETDLLGLVQALQSHVIAHRTTAMIGRSQGQQALPVTFGYRAAGWLDQILRHLDRLDELRPRVEVVQIGGAIGTLASLAPHGLAARAKVAERLGLGEPDISWHSLRDRFVEVVAWCAQVSASLGKTGLDITLSAQTEVAELREGASGISSTMPHKRNAILSQQLMRAARLTRTYLDLALDAAVADHDRATAVWSLEWTALAPALAVAGGATHAAEVLLRALEIDMDAMATNLAKTDGLIMAEAVMMKLAPKNGRQNAHDLVDDMVEQSRSTDATFAEVVAERAPDAVDALDPAAYLGHTSDQIDAVLERCAARLSIKSD